MEWISVEHNMPEQGETVIAYGYGPVFGSVFPSQCVDIDRFEWLDLEEVNCNGDYDITSQVTHWMPLPPPPEDS